MDDNLDLRETLADVLTLSGYAVRVAEHGRAALATARKTRPALILLDLMMPVMTGWEVLEELKNDAELHSVPVIVISGSLSLPEDVPVLRKPVGLDHLLKTVAAVVPRAADFHREPNKPHHAHRTHEGRPAAALGTT